MIHFFTRRITTYRELSKSGIVALVLISVLGGYLAGHPFELPFQPGRLGATLLGVLFLASGSSAWNQIQDLQIDSEMPRTRHRPLPSGRLSLKEAILFVGLSLPIGLAILFVVDPQVALLGVLAVVSYNGLYTLWWKRKWAFAAVPGALPGALPILMGYAAAQGQVWTPGGVFLFFILFFWQMPHFWVLALRYRQDYAMGNIPTLPVAKGTGITVTHILLWSLGYVGLSLGAPLFLKVGPLYLLIAIGTGTKLLWELARFIREPESKRWLRFFLWVNFSLILLIGGAVLDLWSIYLIPLLHRS